MHKVGESQDFIPCIPPWQSYMYNILFWIPLCKYNQNDDRNIKGFSKACGNPIAKALELPESFTKSFTYSLQALSYKQVKYKTHPGFPFSIMTLMF